MTNKMLSDNTRGKQYRYQSQQDFSLHVPKLTVKSDGFMENQSDNLIGTDRDFVLYVDS